jgi:hypothetical protein
MPSLEDLRPVSAIVETYDKNFKFSPAGEFTSFAESELNWYKWLDGVDSIYAKQEYFANFVEQPLAIAKHVVFRDGPVEREAKINSYIASSGATGELIKNALHIHGPQVAFFLLIYIQPDLVDRVSDFSNIEAMLNNSSLDYEKSLGLHLFFAHSKADSFIRTKELKRIESEMVSFRESSKSILSDARSSVEFAEMQARSIQLQLSRLNEENKNAQQKRLRRYRKVFAKAKAAASKNLSDALSDLSSARHTYHAQIDLSSAVEYWDQEVVRHKNAKRRWIAAVIVSITLTFFAPVGYYMFGGVTALARLSHPHQVEERRRDPAGLADRLSSESSASSIYPQSMHSDSSPALISGLADLTGAALLIGLLSIFIRLNLRQYNTHTFLEHEASERRIMTKTYLALSNENSLTSDNDRKIVLEALFRPSQAAGIPESAVSTPIELVVKAITERNK